jgi:hypothetical protein
MLLYAQGREPRPDAIKLDYARRQRIALRKAFRIGCVSVVNISRLLSAQPEENLGPRSAVNRVTLLKNEEFDKACDQ